MTPAEREETFRALRSVLQTAGAGLTIAADSPTRFCLEAKVGPATLRAWKGKLRSPTIPVAWVECGKVHVSYHLMGISGRADVIADLSDALRARMQGKACFNFKGPDSKLLAELARVTGRVLAGMQTAGYTAE